MSETTTRQPTGAEEMVDAARAGAVRPRRSGAWYIAEHQLKQMRSYGWTVVMTGIGSVFNSAPLDRISRASAACWSSMRAISSL